MGRAGEEIVGYGEVWHDPAAGEAELARILVAPDRRGRGVGRRLVALLADRARAAGFDAIWLRVVADNRAAIACYRAAGFVRASAAEESAFNEGQPTIRLVPVRAAVASRDRRLTASGACRSSGPPPRRQATTAAPRTAKKSAPTTRPTILGPEPPRSPTIASEPAGKTVSPPNAVAQRSQVNTTS